MLNQMQKGQSMEEISQA